MKVFERDLLEEAARQTNVSNLSGATIGETIRIAQYLQAKTGIQFVRMDQGSPCLPPNHYGIEAEKEALDKGVGSAYPPPAGFPELTAAASRFIKSFIDIDVSQSSIIATTGSVESSFGLFAILSQRIPGKDKVLFIDPGFPIQKSQLRILGIEWRQFDIYPYRGASALKARLEQELSGGDIAAIVYSNPNNPAWICLEESELKVIGELATEYDAVVMEDLAYFAMDYRRDLCHPGVPPFVPTVARYTDNYALMLSASKIFSYAGQRIALCCVSDTLASRHYPALAARYNDSGVFGETLTSSILYMITSGCTSSTQYGYARMLNLASDGELNFIEDTRIYQRRTERLKELFCRNGFHIVYDKDVTQDVGDGFFFTLGYKGMDSGELAVELLSYGVSTISLATTGSLQSGVRICSSSMKEEWFDILEERMKEFAKDHGNDLE